VGIKKVNYQIFWDKGVLTNLEAIMVLLIKAKQPLRFIKLPFQGGSGSTILSSNGCNEEFGSLETERGPPRYLITKLTSSHGKRLRARFTWSDEHLIGTS
jgi:hypothetical protein